MSTIISFFNSTFFTGFATIITGLVAILVYFRQKSDQKIQAARVLLTEVRSAEERIEQIRERISNNSIADYPPVLPINSWKKYSHLFVSDFDQDELKLINSFYDYCEQVDDFGRKDNQFFWVTTEERAKIAQHYLAKIIEEATAIASSDERQRYIQEKKEIMLTSFTNDGYQYTPNKTLRNIQSYIGKIQNITTTICGQKLKKIARIS